MRGGPGLQETRVSKGPSLSRPLGGERRGGPLFFARKARVKIIIHQSDLSAMARCAAEYGYRRAGMPMATNSAAAYGSVMHHAINVMERGVATGTPPPLALQQAIETFAHYWIPANIHAICDPVPSDGWLPNQKFETLRQRGFDTLRQYADLMQVDDTELLATEFGFSVPIEGTWDYDMSEPHMLAGSVDRLGARHWRRLLFLAVDDFKTGKNPHYLRQNLQGTAYCYATTRPEFWTGNAGEDGFGHERGAELYKRFAGVSRKFTWIDLKDVKRLDGGWRGPLDYSRFAVVVEQFAATVKADVYPLSISASVCRHCDARHVCGGTGLPPDNHGEPANPN